MQFVKKYKNYELHYYFEPGLNQPKDVNINIHNILTSINQKSKRNLEYGIFEKNVYLDYFKLKSFFDKMIICIMYLDHEPVGFFYQYILQKNPIPVIHLGLVLIYKNTGLDLMNLAYRYTIVKIYQYYGNCHITNISGVPSIIGHVSSAYNNVWPSLNVPMRNPYKNYKNIVETLKEQYIIKFFPDNDSLKIDYNRFVLKLNARECGFESNFFKLSKHDEMLVNIFCYTWIDYSSGEEIIQVGQINFYTYLKNMFFLIKRGLYDV